MMSGLPPPEQEQGLLEKIADTALDDDYYVVRAGAEEPSRRFNTVLTGSVMAVFALLVAVAAGLDRCDRPATQRERATLISDIDARKLLLARREAIAESLRARVDDLKASFVGYDASYEELRLIASARPAVGPGLRVRTSSGLESSPITDHDLQTLVNAFWYAGAEAVAINGKRIGSLTSIRTAGGVIKVNYDAVGEPYEIVVLGDPDALEDRFGQTAVGRSWKARAKSGAVRFDVARSDNLTVDAASKGRLTIAHAKAIKGGT